MTRFFLLLYSYRFIQLVAFRGVLRGAWTAYFAENSIDRIVPVSFCQFTLSAIPILVERGVDPLGLRRFKLPRPKTPDASLSGKIIRASIIQVR